jgi:hypothetical protein
MLLLINIIDNDLGSAAINTYREESISLMPKKKCLVELWLIKI